MNTLVLYDDEAARGFEPFALTRPVSELRAGTEIVRRRWETTLGAEATGFIGAAHLADFDELDAPPCTTGPIAAGTILVNARCAPVLAPADPWADVWTCHGRVAAVRLSRAVAATAIRDGSAVIESLAGDGATSTVYLDTLRSPERRDGRVRFLVRSWLTTSACEGSLPLGSAARRCRGTRSGSGGRSTW